MKKKQIAIRMPEESLKRAENLVKAMKHQTFISITRAEALRAALQVGLSHLEKEYGIKNRTR